MLEDNTERTYGADRRHKSDADEGEILPFQRDTHVR